MESSRLCAPCASPALRDQLADGEELRALVDGQARTTPERLRG
ncbi:hypothetical protein AB0K14_11130 [Actinosynnema sp. NPDC050801]